MGQVSNPIMLEWDGFSPLHSNVSSHSDDPKSFTQFSDLITDGAGRIRKRRGRVLIGTAAGAVITALHEFERVAPTTGVVTFYIFRTHSAVIQRWTGAAWSSETLPYTPTSGAQWVFRNFGNRCFAVNGVDAMLVFDGTSWRTVGVATPAAVAGYSLTGPYQIGTVTLTIASTTVTGVIPAIWPAGYASAPIDINGIRYTINTVGTNGNGTTIAPVLTLTEKAKEATSSGLPYTIWGGLMTWGETPPKYTWAWKNSTTGHVSNRAPVTEITQRNQAGVTPVLTIAGNAANTTAYNNGYDLIQIFRTAKDGNVLAAINHSTLNNNNSAGSIVYTEGSTTFGDTALLNQQAPLTTNTAPPTALTGLVSWMGRLFGIRASDPTNVPPDTPRLYYCLINGEQPIGVPEECWPRLYSRSNIPQPKGLVVLGGDLRNTLIVQSSDGDYTIQGHNNLTFTDPYLLPTRRSGGWFGGAIDYQGALIQLYRDKRLFRKAISTYTSSSFESFGEDLGEPVQDKLNTTNTSYVTSSRLARFAWEDTNVLLVATPQGGSTVCNYTLAWDFDHQRVQEWQFGFSAAATVHNPTTGALELWVGDSTGSVYAVAQSGIFTDGGSNYTPAFTTASLAIEERSRLAHVVLYVGPTGAENQTWTLTVYADEDTVGIAYTFEKEHTAWQSAQGRELVVDFGLPVIFSTLKLKVTFPTTAGDLYVEKMLAVIDRESAVADDK